MLLDLFELTIEGEGLRGPFSLYTSVFMPTISRMRGWHAADVRGFGEGKRPEFALLRGRASRRIWRAVEATLLQARDMKKLPRSS